MSTIFYLGQVFFGIHALSIICLIIGIAEITYCGAFYLESYNVDYKYKLKKGFKLGIITTIIGALLLTFVPDRTTWYLMKGADAVEKVATSKEVSETAEKTLKLVNQYLDEKLNTNQ